MTALGCDWFVWLVLPHGGRNKQGFLLLGLENFAVGFGGVHFQYMRRERKCRESTKKHTALAVCLIYIRGRSIHPLFGVIHLAAMVSHLEALIRAFLDDEPQVLMSELKVSLDAVCFKHEDAVLKPCGEIQIGFGGILQEVLVSVGIGVKDGISALHMHVHLRVCDVFKGQAGVDVGAVLLL